MARAKDYRKNIACLESLWNQNIENRLNVVPILELVSKVERVKYTYMTCNTSEELKYNLGKLKQKRGYGILYLSFHGNPGEIVLDEKAIDLETLAVLMGKGFTDWVIHFGTCATIDVAKRRILNFIIATEVSMVVGYKNDVDWMDSAALDLLLLDWLQSYKDMQSLWSHFRKRHADLISITGLKAFHR
jgi:hypothetical protein